MIFTNCDWGANAGLLFVRNSGAKGMSWTTTSNLQNTLKQEKEFLSNHKVEKLYRRNDFDNI